MLRPTTIKTLAVATLFSGTALQPAWAWEAEEVAQRLKASAGEQNVRLDWSSVRQEGDSVLLEAVEVGAPGAPKTIPVGDLMLDEVSEEDENYRVGSIVVDSFRHSDDGVEASLEGLEVLGLIIPKEGAEGPYGGMMNAEHLALRRMEVRGDAPEPLFMLRGLEAENLLDGGGTLNSSGSVEEFFISFPQSAGADSQDRSPLEELGYTSLSGRADMAGSWAPADGRLLLDRYEVQVDDAGTFNMTADISGYTADFQKEMQRVLSEMDADSSEEQARNQGMAMLGLLQQLTLHGASIRFDDASLTGKVLDYIAGQQGGTPEGVANQAKAMVPLMAGQYLGPDLTTSLTKAVTAYLDNPQNLEIRVAPGEPMPFALLAGVAMSSPEALAKQVGLEILANQ